MKVVTAGEFCRRSIACVLGFALAVFTAGCEQRSSQSVVGKPAPDFEFTPIDGKAQRLSDLKGKPAIVNFFATWCGPCMMELPELDKKIAGPYAERGLVVVAVSVDEKSEDAADFAASKKHSFLVASDSKSEIFAKFAGLSREEAIPQTFLIKPDGTIAMHLVGYNASELSELKAEVEKLLSAK